MGSRTAKVLLCGVIAVGSITWGLLGCTASGSIGQESRIRVRNGRGYVYTKPKREGEKDLQRIARTERREDSWLYCNGRWLDIGVEEQATGAQCSLEAIAELADPDGSSRFGRPAEGTSLVWYHVHPFTLQSGGVYPPNVEDILALVLLKQRCRKELGCEVTGRMFDGTGTWDFNLRADLEQKMCREQVPAEGRLPVADFLRDHPAIQYSPRRQAEVAWLSFYLNHETAAQAVLRHPGQSRQETINRYIAALREIGVVLEYRKLE